MLSFTDCVVEDADASYYGSVIYNRLSAVVVSNMLVQDVGEYQADELGTFFNSGGSYDCTSACSVGEYGEVGGADRRVRFTCPRPSHRLA